MVVWELLIEIFISLQAFWYLFFGRILSIDKNTTDFPWRYFLTTNLIFSLAVTNKAVSAWLAMWSQRKLLFFVLNFAKKRHSWELPSYILIVLQLLTVTSSHKKVKGKEAKREKKRNSLNETYWSFNVDFSWFTWAPFLYEVIVTIMCRNDELSWLFTNRLSATR